MVKYFIELKIFFTSEEAETTVYGNLFIYAIQPQYDNKFIFVNKIYLFRPS